MKLITTIGWENIFLVHGVFILLLCLPTILILHTFKPKEENHLPYGAKPKDLESDEADKEELKPARTLDFIGVTFFALIAVAFLQTFDVDLNQNLPGTAMLDCFKNSWKCQNRMLFYLIFPILIGILV